MKKLGKLVGVLIIMAIVASLCQGINAAENATRWVGTWGCSPQLTESNNMPPSPGLSNNTLRQVIHTSISGERVRIEFSNEYGNSPLTINSASLAQSGGNGLIKSETDKALTFGSKASVTIPAGKTVYSDELDFSVPKLSDLAITINFGSVPSALTGHPGSRTTSYIKQGNAIKELNLSSGAKTDHWYVITKLDVLKDSTSNAVVILGDSITDGRGSTTNGNDRWPDFLARRLQENSSTANIGVLNMGVGGNTVLSGGLGPTAVTRFNRDVLNQSGVKWAIIYEGVNDIGSSSGQTVANNLINAFKDFIKKAHDKNIIVYGVPILPFGGSQYSSADHEKSRQTVNNWIRTSGQFDAVIDLDAAVRDSKDASKLLSTYDSGDHLHLNPAGYKKMGEAIDLKLFTQK